MNEILCNVFEFCKYGKSGRSFEILQEDFEIVIEIFVWKMMIKINRFFCVKFVDCNVDYLIKQKNNLYEYYYMFIDIEYYIMFICLCVYIFCDW